MTTEPISSATTIRGSTDVPPPRRRLGAAALFTLAASIAALAAAPKQDIVSDTQLHGYLDDRGPLLLVAWLLTLVSGLAWLLFVVGVRGRLRPGAGRDLMITAAVAGQVLTWSGSSLITAAAPPAARSLPLSVYEAFGEAGHLAGSAGTAATGLALIGLSRCASPQLWGAALSRATAVVGAILLLCAVIGPISAPLYALWLLVIGVQMLRPVPETSMTAAHAPDGSMAT